MLPIFNTVIAWDDFREKDRLVSNGSERAGRAPWRSDGVLLDGRSVAGRKSLQRKTHSQSERNTRQLGPEWLSHSPVHLIYENRISIRYAAHSGDYPGHHPTQLLEGGKKGAVAGVGHGIF